MHNQPTISLHECAYNLLLLRLRDLNLQLPLYKSGFLTIELSRIFKWMKQDLNLYSRCFKPVLCQLELSIQIIVADKERFELSTYALTGHCSAVELSIRFWTTIWVDLRDYKMRIVLNPIIHKSPQIVVQTITYRVTSRKELLFSHALNIELRVEMSSRQDLHQHPCDPEVSLFYDTCCYGCRVWTCNFHCIRVGFYQLK